MSSIFYYLHIWLQRELYGVDVVDDVVDKNNNNNNENNNTLRKLKRVVVVDVGSLSYL